MFTPSAVALVLALVLGFFSLTGRLSTQSSHPAVTVPNALLPSGFSPTIERLQQYLRIRTDHPHPDYHAAADFLNETIAHLLPSARIRRVELVPGKPIVIATLQGSDRTLPSLLLNSHTDVVPAEASKWQRDPFAANLAFVDYQWRLYARGAQDMKSVGLQYVEALAALAGGGWEPLRTVHVTFVPDEEIGGTDGLRKLVDDGRSRLWRELNVGAGLDEGLPNPGPGFNVYYGERRNWWLVVEAEGAPAHGALAPEDTAVQAIHRVLDRALQFRERERQKTLNSSYAGKDGGPLNIGETVGVNVVFLESGIKSDKSESGFVMNMIPSRARAGLDIRVPPHMSSAEMDAEIQSWLSCRDEVSQKICDGLSHHFLIKDLTSDTTDRSHPFSNAFMAGLREARMDSQKPIAFPATFHAATDARFVRAVGVPSIGFSPIENTPDMLHKHDEFISVDGYRAGIRIYSAIIKRLAGIWPLSSGSVSNVLDENAHLGEQHLENIHRDVSDRSEL
jgi:aminoacylase